MPERVIDDLELIEVEAVQREQAAAPFGSAEMMIELLLEHRPVRKSRQRVIEGELHDPLLALGDPADHHVETFGQPRQLVLSADMDLDVLTRGEPASSFVELARNSRLVLDMRWVAGDGMQP